MKQLTIKQQERAIELLNHATGFIDVARFELGEEFDEGDLEGEINAFLDEVRKNKVFPIRQTGGSRTASLAATYKEIVDAVGEPNVTNMDDEDKVKASWGFQDEKGRQGFIWCYKFYGNVEKCTGWSLDGDMTLLKELFGKKVC